MKGIIAANLGESRYTVAVTTDTSILAMLKESAQDAHDKAVEALNGVGNSGGLYGTEATARAAYDAAMAEVDALSDEYSAARDAISDTICLDEKLGACDATRAAALDACHATFLTCQSKCDDLPCFFACELARDSCEAAAESAWDACTRQARLDCVDYVAEQRKAALDKYTPLIAAAQKKASEALAAWQAAARDLAYGKARLLSADQALAQLGGIESKEINITAWSAQYNADMEPDDEVEVAMTPSGRHVITEIFTADPCLHDARAMPAYNLFVNAAVATGVETWRPRWRIGTVLELNDDDDKTLKVDVSGGTLTGSLGTINSRRIIDCTPPQAWFDESGSLDTTGAARAAYDAAWDAYQDTLAARQACYDAYDLPACVAAANAACEASCAQTIIDCGDTRTDGIAACAMDQGCIDGVEAQYAECVSLADGVFVSCVSAATADCLSARDAAWSVCDSTHAAAISAAETALSSARADLINAQYSIARPASPLIIDIPVAHCNQSAYMEGDDVLIDFQSRSASHEIAEGATDDQIRAAAMAVWNSARVVGWASETRQCIYLESGWLTFEDRTGSVDPFVYLYPDDIYTIWSIVPAGVDLLYNSYQSLETRDEETTHRTEIYSGLMRLFMQSLVGANRTISDAIGGSFTPGVGLAKTTGLIRSPDGEYWLVWLGSASIKAMKLDIPAGSNGHFQRLQNWASKMSADDAKYLEAIVLSQLKYNADASILTLIASDDADLASMLQVGYESMPWGICWRYQSRGATDENICGAVWTVHHESSTGTPPALAYFQELRKALIEIEFISGVPVATIAVEEFDRIELWGRGPVAVFSTNVDEVQQLFGVSSVIFDSSGYPPVPVLSWYDSDGYLHDLEIEYVAAETTVDESWDNRPACDGEPRIVGFTQRWRHAFASLTLDDAELIDSNIYRGAQGYELNSVTTFADPQEITIPSLSTSSLGTTYTNNMTSCNDAEDSFVYAAWYSVVVSAGYRSSLLTGDQTTKKSVDPAIIISDIPGCVWALSLGKPADTGSTNNNVVTDPWLRGNREVWTRLDGSGSFTATYETLPAYQDYRIWVPAESYTGIKKASIICIKDTDAIYGELDSDEYDAALAWLGTKKAFYDGTLSSDSFSITTPNSIGFQPAVCGYIAVREMFGDGLGDAFNARAYEYTGRLIGAA